MGEEGGNVIPLSVGAKDLTYKIWDKKEKCWKIILDNLSMCVKPNQLMAVMGASGSGKTTLLNALAGRLRVNRNHVLEGEVLFNGSPLTSGVSKFSNYVMQQDHLLPYLTVEESLTFAARLKLKHLSSAERRAKVNQVISELRLDECRHVPIGGALKKGISGGQKKRVSIGSELLDEPSLLFLDEPTSGLDSSLAYDTLRLLVDLARGGRTVICTVHQPRSQVFSLFDQLLLLANGQVVYHGAASDALEHFSSLGFSCPSHFNPADFFLDLLSASTKKVSSPKTTTATAAASQVPISDTEEGHSVFEGVYEVVYGATDNTPGSNIDVSRQLSRVRISERQISLLPLHYKDSRSAQHLQECIAETIKHAQSGVLKGALQSRKFKRKNAFLACLDSLIVLTHRTMLNTLRNPLETLAGIVVNLIFGLFVGGIFFQLNFNPLNFGPDVSNFGGLLFFAIMQFAFSQLDSLLTLPQQRALFNIETANGLYSPISYFMAQNIAKLPFQHLPPIIFAILIYWMAGLAPNAGQFFLHLLIGTACIFASVSYSLMIGAAFCRLETINIVAPLGLVIFSVLGGFFLRDDMIPKWISWLKYISFLRYTLFGLCQAQFPPGEFFFGVANDKLLAFLSVPLSPTIWENFAIIMALGVGMRVISFFLLVFTNRNYGLEA